MRREIPPSLLRQIQDAWNYDMPALPEDWRTDPSEPGDLFRSFAGKTWDAVVSADFPDYFSALTWLRSTCPAASVYYLASYLVAFFASRAHIGAHLLDQIETFLLSLLESPEETLLSGAQIRAIECFLESVREDAYWTTYPNLIEKWKALECRVDPN